METVIYLSISCQSSMRVVFGVDLGSVNVRRWRYTHAGTHACGQEVNRRTVGEARQA